MKDIKLLKRSYHDEDLCISKVDMDKIPLSVSIYNKNMRKVLEKMKNQEK